MYVHMTRRDINHDDDDGDRDWTTTTTSSAYLGMYLRIMAVGVKDCLPTGWLVRRIPDINRAKIGKLYCKKMALDVRVHTEK